VFPQNNSTSECFFYDPVVLGAFLSRGNSINSNDQVTGTAFLEISDPFGAHLRGHAFLYSNGQSMDLGSLGGGVGSSSAGMSINNGGQVTGFSQTANGSSHAFLYGNGQMIDLGTLPGWENSFGESINNYGEVTGVLAGSHNAAFVWRDGVMQNLNDLIDPSLGVTLGVGIAINDKGQILAGVGTEVTGNDFLLTPVPESGTVALLALGLAALLWSNCVSTETLRRPARPRPSVGVELPLTSHLQKAWREGRRLALADSLSSRPCR
jgi:probable HAF family extracellular repeat protein